MNWNPNNKSNFGRKGREDSLRGFCRKFNISEQAIMRAYRGETYKEVEMPK